MAESYERRDERWARARFHELAARVAAGSGTLTLAPGRRTRVAVELLAARPVEDVFAEAVPGKRTQAQVDEARWEPHGLTLGAPLDGAGALGTTEAAGSTLPHRSEVAGLLSSLSPDAQAARTRVQLDPAVSTRMGRLLGADLSRVEVVPASALATGATKAVTVDGEVHFRAGAYQPGTAAGDWLIAHELAHVVQQRGGQRSGTRKQIEREADRAASLVARGHTAPIALRAQPQVAYAFSEGEDHASHDEASGDGRDERDATQAVEHGKPDARANGAEPRGSDALGSQTEAPQDADDAHGSGAEPRGSDALGSQTEAPHADTDDVGVEAIGVIPAEPAPAAPSVGGGAPARPQKPAPELGAAKPEAALAQMQGVRPDRLARLFGRVHSEAHTEVSQERAKLQANPPKQMSTGAAAAKAMPPDAKAGEGAKPDPNAKPGNAKDAPDQPVKANAPGADAAKQSKQQEIAAQREAILQVAAATKRQVASWFNMDFDGKPEPGTEDRTVKMSEAETRQMSGALDRLPTTASEVSTDPGPAPELAMKGEAQSSADRVGSGS